jgi:hypothetical protein
LGLSTQHAVHNLPPDQRPAARPPPTYSSNPVQSLPSNVSPTLLDHGLPVYLWADSISICNCISKLAPSWPPSASLSPLDLGLLVHVQTHLVMASQCISQFTQFRSPMESPNMLFHGLQVNRGGNSISVSKCIPILAQSRPSESISEFTWRSSSRVPRLAYMYPLKPVQI